MSVLTPVIDYVDPVARRIYLLVGVTRYHPVDDIYKEMRRRRATDETIRGYFNFVSGSGNLPKNLEGTERTPRQAIFNNCKVVLSGDTEITGEQLYANAAGELIGKGKDCIDRVLSPANAYADYAPPEAEVIEVNTGGTLLTAEQAAEMFVAHVRLGEMWKLKGLDETDPVLLSGDNAELVMQVGGFTITMTQNSVQRS